MTGAHLDDTIDLVRAARGRYDGDAAAESALAELDRRLREPLRLALAGMVKAGKSTLLNALVGERVAPTDAGECTRVVTWYRYGDTPSVTLRLRDGESRRMAVRRDAGRLVLSLGDVPVDDVGTIDVVLPAGRLRSTILIDTPGIASLSERTSERSTDFLTPEASPSAADAVVYLMRHLHQTDFAFLEAFRDTAAGASRTVNAVAVLSRADEIGSGRIDSLLSASKVAHRYERDGALNSLVLGVIPIAGLVAEGARALREREYRAFRALSELDRRDRERLLVSADRFVRASDVTSLSAAEREMLIGRFGIFGVRLATSLIRSGVRDSTQLAERLVEQSGLTELAEFVRLQFRARADALKTRGVLDALDELVRSRNSAADLLGGIERLQSTSHALRELSLLSTARTQGLPLTPQESADAARIVGADGIDAAARVGLPADASRPVVAERVREELARWRARSQSPLTPRATVAVCRVVIRSLEEVASHVGAGAAAGTAPDVVLLGGPVEGAREGADHEGEEHEDALDGDELTEQGAVVARRSELE